MSEHHLAELAELIRATADKAGYPNGPSTDVARQTFDVQCAEILCTRMQIVATEAASIDIWAFFGVVVLPDVMIWRFPRPPADRLIGPDLTRHTLARLWWRAYQLVDLMPGSRFEALGSIPESEMNQIFERRSIGGDRALVRSIARILAYDSTLKVTGINRRDVVRDAIARIRRLTAFTVLGSRDVEVLDGLIRGIFAESLAVLSRPSNDATRTHQAAEKWAPASSSSKHTNKGERDGEGDDPDQDGSLRDFETVRLAAVPVQIANLVTALGGVADNELPEKYERRFRIRVPSDREALLKRFAWSAKGRRFVGYDEANLLWLPGNQEPTEIEELGDWTINAIRSRARAMLKDKPRSDPFDRLLSEVYRANGKRTPRFVMSLVGTILNEQRRQQ